MKQALILILTFISLTVFGQVEKYSNFHYFLPDVTVKKYAGKDFRFQIDIKSLPADTASKVRTYALQVGKNEYDFIERNYSVRVLEDTLWNTRTITGKLSERVNRIWFYVDQVGNGKFYIDNLRLEVKENEGWVSVPIPFGDFELADNKNPLNGFQKSEKLPVGTQLSIASVANPLPSNALLITAEGGKKKWVTHYGANPTTGKYCDINGTRIYYETYGEGDPLLLLHGNGQSISAFARQIPALAGKYRVIAVDTRAQGRSLDTVSTSLSYKLFADDMKVLLDSLGIRKVHIVGWSDGGNTALTMAIKYPDYVDRIAMMGANLNPSTEAVQKGVLKQTSKDLSILKSRNDPRARLLAMLLTEPNISIEELKTIKSRTLVMAGEKDIIKEQHTKLIAASISLAELRIFRGQTHNMPQENAAFFNEAVIAFLTKE